MLLHEGVSKAYNKSVLCSIGYQRSGFLECASEHCELFIKNNCSMKLNQIKFYNFVALNLELQPTQSCPISIESRIIIFT